MSNNPHHIPMFALSRSNFKRLLFLYSFFLALAIILFWIVYTSFVPFDFCQDCVATHHFLLREQVYVPTHCWVNPFPDSHGYPAHPPFSLLVYLPLVFFSMTTASLLWGIISFVCFEVAIMYLLKMFHMYSFRTFAFVMMIVPFWSPAIMALGTHNIAGLLLLLLVSSLLYERDKKEVPAGVLLGIASLLRVWPVVFLLSAFIQRRWIEFASGMGAILCGLAIYFVIFGGQAYSDYFGPVKQDEYAYLYHIGNISLPAVITRFATSFHIIHARSAFVDWIGLFILIVAFFYILFIVLHKRRSQETTLLIFGFLLITLLICIPVIWTWEISYLIIPLASMGYLMRKKQVFVTKPLLYLSIQFGVFLLEPDWVVTWLLSVNPQEVFLSSLPTLSLVFFAFLFGYILWQLPHRSTRLESRRVLVNEARAK